MISSNWSLSVTEHRDYLFFGFFTASSCCWPKEVYWSCSCTGGLTEQIMALCLSLSQYRHRFCCIQRLLSARDSGLWGQDWTAERFIESLLTVTPVMCAETAACVVTVKREEEVLKVASHGHVTEGVIVDLMKAHNCEVITRARGLSCWAAQWQLSMFCSVCVKVFKLILVTSIGMR